MSDPLALYDAFAGAASIFIGIIAAFLVSSLINKENELEQIEHQVGSINGRLEAIDDRRSEIDDRLEGIFDEKHRSKLRQKANDSLDEFLGDIVGEEWSPTEDPEHLGTRWGESVNKFKEFVGDEEWNYYTTDVLRIRFVELLSKAGLTESRENAGGDCLTVLKREFRQLWNQHQHEQILDRRIAARRELNRDVRELNNGYDWLESRFESIGTKRERNIFWVLTASILLSVIIPLSAHALYVIDYQISEINSLGFEVMVISASWILGLVLVLYHLNDLLGEEKSELDNLYEVDPSPMVDDLPNLIEIPPGLTGQERQEYVDNMTETHSRTFVNESSEGEE